MKSNKNMLEFDVLEHLKTKYLYNQPVDVLSEMLDDDSEEYSYLKNFEEGMLDHGDVDVKSGSKSHHSLVLDNVEELTRLRPERILDLKHLVVPSLLGGRRIHLVVNGFDSNDESLYEMKFNETNQTSGDINEKETSANVNDDNCNVEFNKFFNYMNHCLNEKDETEPQRTIPEPFEWKVDPPHGLKGIQFDPNFKFPATSPPSGKPTTSSCSLLDAIVVPDESSDQPNLNIAELMINSANTDFDDLSETVFEHDGVSFELPQTNDKFKEPLSKFSMKSNLPSEHVECIDVTKPFHDFSAKVPNMARVWDFELDTFQKQAVFCLEKSKSVFVGAHTSAGKTVVAEYAIALSQKHMTRCIYTSPIKALSNQKFRDFKSIFGQNEVGILTGDVQINSTASCLIMTTEVLRSMLYNRSSVIADLEYVIFDEVHYINDYERGVVWEESLILLPDHVVIVMLSATLPNVVHFVEWVGKIKNRRIAVINTPRRPVPLHHYIYVRPQPSLTNDASSSSKSKSSHSCCQFMIQDGVNNFSTDGYNSAYRRLNNPSGDSGNKNNKKGGGSGGSGNAPLGGGIGNEKNVWLEFIQHLKKNDKLPVVIFTFSRKRCDRNAQLLKSVDLTSSQQKSEVHHFTTQCLDRLKGSDKTLPQVVVMVDMLKRGIAVHHSGVLPILKEMIELLFQRGLVKLMFATETFAIGINMPTRSVAFDGIRKHDGFSYRNLLPSEYIQMAGRAGRRGLDVAGTVFILVPSPNLLPSLSELHTMMQGRVLALESKFRLTYSMILNLHRADNLRVEDMLKRSFSETRFAENVSQTNTQLQELMQKLSDMNLNNDDSVVLENNVNQNKDYMKMFTLAKDLHHVKMKCWSVVLSNTFSTSKKHALCAGQVLWVRNIINRCSADHSNLKTRGPSLVKLAVLVAVEEPTNTSQNNKSGKMRKFLVMYLTPELNFTPSVGSNKQHVDEYFECLLSECMPILPEPPKHMKFSAVFAELTDQDIMCVEGSNSQPKNALKSINFADILQEVVKKRVISSTTHFGVIKNKNMSDCMLPLVEYVMKQEINLAGKHISAKFAFYNFLKLTGIAASTDMELLEDIQKLKSTRVELSNLVIQHLTSESLESDEIEPMFTVSDLPNAIYNIYSRKQLEDDIRKAKREMSEASLKLFPDYLNRLSVLHELSYIDMSRDDNVKISPTDTLENEKCRINESTTESIVMDKLRRKEDDHSFMDEAQITVKMKGHVACQLGSHELLMTELLLDNVLTDLNATEVAALLSSFVYLQKKDQSSSKPKQQFNSSISQSVVKGLSGGGSSGSANTGGGIGTPSSSNESNASTVLSKNLYDAMQSMNRCIERLSRIQTRCGLDRTSVDDNLMLETYNFDLVEVVHCWASGTPFSDIMLMTEVQEGVIVRTIQRLDELLRQVKDAARVIGDPDLYTKMETSSQLIRRDIVFTPSLYTVLK